MFSLNAPAVFESPTEMLHGLPNWDCEHFWSLLLFVCFSYTFLVKIWHRSVLIKTAFPGKFQSQNLKCCPKFRRWKRHRTNGGHVRTGRLQFWWWQSCLLPKTIVLLWLGSCVSKGSLHRTFDPGFINWKVKIICDWGQPGRSQDKSFPTQLETYLFFTANLEK